MPILSAETSQERTDHAPLSDLRLVKECLEGSDTAWAALIDKYKNLIFSIPIKYGFPRDGQVQEFDLFDPDQVRFPPR